MTEEEIEKAIDALQNELKAGQRFEAKGPQVLTLMRELLKQIHGLAEHGGPTGYS